jgi:hypothetical protein
LFKTQELRDKAIIEIKRINGNIAKNEESIRNSERIINLAQEKGNTQAEMIAKEALMKAQEAKRKNEETKKEWELKKIRADRSYATIHNRLSQNNGSNSKIKGFVTDYTGRVEIIKANSERVTGERGFLEPGDKVMTLNGTAEIQALDGRATAKLGPYSELVMKKDTPEEQVVELVKGKVYMAVDKVDDYVKMLDEKLKEYKENNSVEQSIRKLKAEIIRWSKKFEVLTAGGGGAVRGTKFLVFEDDKTGTEIIVLEGSVEMKGIKGERTIVVHEGNKGAVTRDGKLSEPEKIDISNVEKWWER